MPRLQNRAEQLQTKCVQAPVTQDMTNKGMTGIGKNSARRTMRTERMQNEVTKGRHTKLTKREKDASKMISSKNCRDGCLRILFLSSHSSNPSSLLMDPSAVKLTTQLRARP